MAYYTFCKNILLGKKIFLFNNGNHSRSFTYISDAIKIVNKIIILEDKIKKFEIFNVGNSKKVKLNYFIRLFEKYLNKKAIKVLTTKQRGDVDNTWCSTKKLKKYTGVTPVVNIEEGLKKYVYWFIKYYS